jgi:hypothetical protein
MSSSLPSTLTSADPVAYAMPTDCYERVHVSDSARTIVCALAAGNLERPLPECAPDWEEVFQGVCRNGLQGLTYRYLTRGVSRDVPPAGFKSAVQRAHYLRAVDTQLMYRQIAEVLARLAEAGIDCLVLKGPALAYTIYPHPTLRLFSDLDLMAREHDWAAAHGLLIDLGFAPEAGFARPRAKLIPQATTYEVKYWHEEMQLRVEMHFDDLLNAGLASRDLDGYWRRAVPLRIGAVPSKTLAIEDQLLHLCAHAHYHGYTRLNWLTDLAFIVRDHAAELDWERFVATVRLEEAQVCAYYSLRILNELLGIGAPRCVMDAIRPDGVRRWLHEYYLPERHVLSLDPMPRPDFSFYFLPLLKRLLPDLLVMGRRREKLGYLLRLLVPPRQWLRDYYELDERSSVAPHYLVHPLKLGRHYMTEIVSRLAENVFRHRPTLGSNAGEGA